MLGAIIGDIVGSIYERNSIKTKNFKFWGAGCTFTDDTVMTLAVADAILEHLRGTGDFKEILVNKMQEFGRKYPLAGYGKSFANWIYSECPEPYNSFGNGSAMRVSACAWLFGDLESVIQCARMSAEVTHNHPEGIKGAEAVAAAVFLAKQKHSKEEIKNYIEDNYYPLNMKLNEIRQIYHFDVTCQGTVPQAIIAFLESESFEDAIRNAVSLGGDSDTLAAITGSIAEVYYGIPKDIQEKATGYLDEFLKSVLAEFNNAVIKNSKQNKLSEKEKNQILLDLVSGCIFGGAIGDALGYPVEFMKYKNIINEYGDEGITEFDLRHSGKAEISDDTQMTLYTANALLYGETRGALRGIAGPMKGYIFAAYQNWYYSQIGKDIPKIGRNSWIYNYEALRESRAPGNSCLSAIATSGGTGSPENEINNSKGCGGVMRVAPIGCYYAKSGSRFLAAKVGAEAAALTHGHPLGYIPAAFLSCLVCEIIKDKLAERKTDLLDLVNETLEIIREMYCEKLHYNEFEDIIKKAIALSGEIHEDADAISQLGEGWVAEEALAIAVYSALKYKDRFHKGVICAVNHNGDSDSTGAITGNILGAYLGLSAIDTDGSIINKLEAYDVMYEISQDLVKGCEMSEFGKYEDVKWLSKYVYCNYGE